MIRQYILNRRLNNLYKKEQNNYLSDKIKRAKSLLNITCPKSFEFYKNEFKAGLTKNTCI